MAQPINIRYPIGRDIAARLEADLGKPITVCDDWRSCLDGADILVEAIDAGRPAGIIA